jgi:hypothetical protein
MELQVIQSKIYEVRRQRVMLDFDLADLYEVETRILKQAVKRNLPRFPSDFMFELTKDEWVDLRLQIETLNLDFLRSQNVTSSDKNAANPVDSREILRSQNVTSSWGGTRYMPYAFTEQGVAMLSSVLKWIFRAK